MAHIFYGSLMSTAIRELLDNDDAHIDEVIEEFTDIYLNGILIWLFNINNFIIKYNLILITLLLNII